MGGESKEGLMVGGKKNLKEAACSVALGTTGLCGPLEAKEHSNDLCRQPAGMMRSGSPCASEL